MQILVGMTHKPRSGEMHTGIFSHSFLMTVNQQEFESFQRLVREINRYGVWGDAFIAIQPLDEQDQPVRTQICDWPEA